ncbi:MAG: outer membrane beta-barrel domain-containing protein [Deltaproteobacteria bacterium]|nr:outer membrane beta-barrel domain-containing protein [Deltaproteobacteria bacterium]
MRNYSVSNPILFTTWLFVLILFCSSAGGEAPKQAGQKVDIKKIEKEYWQGTDRAPVEVVQNRFYTKSNKFELGVFGALVSTDPFLSVKAAGASLGYHISEYFSIHALYWKDYVSPSSASDTLATSNGSVVNTNEPKSFKGAEIAFYPLYGKLSLVGKSIVYFDAFLLAGGGLRETESGNAPAMMTGLGSQLYLSRIFTIRLDYRIFFFKEKLIQKTPASLAGTDLGTRNELNGIFTLGFTALFNLF